MSDLIGLKKYSKPSDSEHGLGDPSAPPTAPSTAGAKPFGSQGMWMGLLVVDSLLIAVFGSYLGVVGMKAYHQWGSGKPAATVPAKPAKTETPPAQIVAKAAAEPAKTEPAKPAAKTEPAKPAAKAEPAKPAAKAEAAKTPAKPEPAKPVAKEPPPKESAPSEPAGDAGVKALPVDFSYNAPDAKSVKLAGAFLVRGGGKKDMVRNPQGDWNLTLYLKPGTYRYWFLEDGKRKVDPQNSKIERGASVVVVYPK